MERREKYEGTSMKDKIIYKFEIEFVLLKGKWKTIQKIFYKKVDSSNNRTQFDFENEKVQNSLEILYILCLPLLLLLLLLPFSSQMYDI